MNELKRRSDLPTLSEGSSDLGSRWRKRDPDRKPEGAYAAGIRDDGKYFLQSWKDVFNSGRLSSDLLSGLTVAAVALPLNVALAVACGLPAGAGIIAGAIGGILAGAFGGSPLQVTGPAAALSTMVLALVVTYGAQGAMAGAILVGLMQIIFFFTRAGGLAKYVPESVLAGFTTGVGLKLLDQQIPLLIDVEIEVHSLLTQLHSPVWLSDVNWLAVLCGLAVIAFMLGLSKYPKVPAAIIGIALATAVSHYLGWDINRVGKVPAELPSLAFPEMALSQWISLAIACVPLGVLATVESLLSAQAVDRMSQTKTPHAPNLESLGQSIANIGSGLFGGMPVSGVIVRSSVNVQTGARTRLSTMTHGLILLVLPIYGAFYIGIIPIAALAGLLCLIGYRLVEVSTLWHLFKENKLHAIAFSVAAIGTLTGNLSVGLISAMVIAGFAQWLEHRKEKSKELSRKKKSGPALPTGIRARIPGVKVDHFYKTKPGTFHLPEEDWQAHINRDPVIHPTAFVHGNASVVGHVILAPGVHVATEAALRADEGTPFYIGRDTNIQDGVVLHALKSQWVEVADTKYAIYVGERVSLAHQSLVHGPSYVGNDTFVGFKAIVHNAVVGDNCFIGHGAIVIGCEIPDGRQVLPGSIIDSNEKAAALPISEHGQRHFNEDVVGVNTGLAEAYHSCCAPRPRPQLQAEPGSKQSYAKLVQPLNHAHPHARGEATHN